MTANLNVPNLDKLIAHLEVQPPELVNMHHVFGKKIADIGECGCIAFHAGRLQTELNPDEWLGITSDQSAQLFMPDGWRDEQEAVRRYPAHRVIATLKRLRDRFLATGEVVVDWGPEPDAGEPWAAPQAMETSEAVSSPVAIPTPELFDPPELPEMLTRLLGAKVEA